MSTNEIWRDIVGFEGKYQVSNLGRQLSQEHRRKISVSLNKYYSNPSAHIKASEATSNWWRTKKHAIKG